MKMGERFALALQFLRKGEVVTTSSQVGWTGSPNYSEVSYEAMVRYGWRKNELIFACINKTANTASQVGLAVGNPANNQHPLKKLIQNPNPYMSESDFWYAVITYQKLAGRAIFEKARSRSGQVVQLWPLRPDWVSVKLSGAMVGSYVYEPPGVEPVVLRPQDVVDFQLFDPLNQFGGWPPVAVAARIGDVDNAVTDFVKLFFEKGGTPPLVITSTQKLIDTSVMDIRRRWKERYGGYEHWLEPAVLDSDAKIERIGMTFEEMGFTGLDYRNEARICMVLDVPPILVGANVGLERSTYSNYAEAQKSWWQDSLMPLYTNFLDVVENQLAPDFGDPLVKWDFSAVATFQEERSLRWQRAQGALSAGAITVNEFRSEVGMQKTAGQDVFLRPMNMVAVPVGEEIEVFEEEEIEDTEEEPIVNEDEKAEYPATSGKRADKAGKPKDDEERKGFERLIAKDVRGFFDGQLGRIGKTINKKAVTDLDQAFWDEEDDELAKLLLKRIKAAALMAAEFAAEALIKEMGVGVDWALVNQAVVKWARKYSYDLAKGINETTKGVLQSVIPDWIESGEPLQALIDSLAPTFGAARAETIGVTEVTRAFAEGNVISWKDSGVVTGKKWFTANDELVCPDCGPLDGTTVGLEGDGFTTEDGGIGVQEPPLHVNCRCWLGPVV